MIADIRFDNAAKYLAVPAVLSNSKPMEIRAD
jgi:hypothetical protein